MLNEKHLVSYGRNGAIVEDFSTNKAHELLHPLVILLFGLNTETWTFDSAENSTGPSNDETSLIKTGASTSIVFRSCS